MAETTAIVESLKLAPALLALIVVVYLFIQAQQWMIKHNEEISKERVVLFADAIKTMHADNIEAKAKAYLISEKVVQSNTDLQKTLAKVDVALSEATVVIRHAKHAGQSGS